MTNTSPTSAAPPPHDHGSRHATSTPSDAEKYRWIRSHRGNFAIDDALASSDRDADFDIRIEREMEMSAAGRDSYACGNRPYV